MDVSASVSGLCSESTPCSVTDGALSRLPCVLPGGALVRRASAIQGRHTVHDVDCFNFGSFGSIVFADHNGFQKPDLGEVLPYSPSQGVVTPLGLSAPVFGDRPSSSSVRSDSTPLNCSGLSSHPVSLSATVFG